MLNEILDIASKYVDSAEVYYLESNSTPVKFESNRLKKMESKETRGVCLRVIKNGRMGFSATTDLDPGKFGQLVKFAVDIAEFGTETPWNFPTGKIESTSFKMAKPIKADYLTETGEKIISEVLSHEPETLNDVSLSYGSSREIIMNTNGISGHRERDAVSFSLVSNVTHENDMLYIYDGITTNNPELNYLPLTEKILEMLGHSKAIFRIESGRMPVIFTPKALNSLLIPVEPALNGKSILRGSSFFTQKLGEKVMDSRITIFEDPASGLSPILFDDEGVPTQKNVFIENGILKSFYYDTQTAFEAGVQSTGNGYRSGLSSVSPATSTFNFEKGDTAYQDMIAQIDEGVIIDQVLGAGQGNTLSGAFSINIALGFLVRKGKIIGRIKDCMVAGNTFEALNQIIAIEDKTHLLSGGTTRLPAVLFDNISIISKA